MYKVPLLLVLLVATVDLARANHRDRSQPSPASIVDQDQPDNEQSEQLQAFLVAEPSSPMRESESQHAHVHVPGQPCNHPSHQQQDQDDDQSRPTIAVSPTSLLLQLAYNNLFAQAASKELPRYESRSRAYEDRPCRCGCRCGHGQAPSPCQLCNQRSGAGQSPCCGQRYQPYFYPIYYDAATGQPIRSYSYSPYVNSPSMMYSSSPYGLMMSGLSAYSPYYGGASYGSSPYYSSPYAGYSSPYTSGYYSGSPYYSYSAAPSTAYASYASPYSTPYGYSYGSPYASASYSYPSVSMAVPMGAGYGPYGYYGVAAMRSPYTSAAYMMPSASYAMPSMVRPSMMMAPRRRMAGGYLPIAVQANQSQMYALARYLRMAQAARFALTS